MANNEYKLEKWVYGIKTMVAKGSRSEILDAIAVHIDQYDRGDCAFKIFRGDRALDIDEKISTLDAARNRKDKIIEKLDDQIGQYIAALRKKEPDLTKKLVASLKAREEFNA